MTVIISAPDRWIDSIKTLSKKRTKKTRLRGCGDDDIAINKAVMNMPYDVYTVILQQSAVNQLIEIYDPFAD